MVRRFLVTLLWAGVLAVIAVRPWVLGLPQEVPMVQWIGLIVGVLWWISRLPLHRRFDPWLAASTLTLLLAFLLSSFWGHDRREVIVEGHGLVFGIVLCAGVAHATAAQRQQLLSVLVALGTLLSLHALYQAFVLFPVLAQFPWSQLTAQGPWQHLPVHTVEYAATVIQRRRVFGPFPLPGLLAAALAVLLPLSVATLRPWATTRPRRLITVIVCGLQVVALFLTQSLGGLGSACAATWCVLVWRRRPWRWALLTLGVTLVSVATLLVLRPELSDLQHARNPIAQRWRYWISTVHMIRQHPLRGIGAGNYAESYPAYRRPLATDTRFAHNALLQVWAEWGLLGALGVVGLLLRSVRLAARQPPGYQVAVLAFWLTALIDVTWSSPQLVSLWWPVLGLGAVSAHADERPVDSA